MPTHPYHCGHYTILLAVHNCYSPSKITEKKHMDDHYPPYSKPLAQPQRHVFPNIQTQRRKSHKFEKTVEWGVFLFMYIWFLVVCPRFPARFHLWTQACDFRIYLHFIYMFIGATHQVTNPQSQSHT